MTHELEEIPQQHTDEDDEQWALERLFEVEMGHWWYLARRGIVADLLKPYHSKKSSWQVLDLGCGTGANLRSLRDWGRVIGIDMNPKALHYSLSRGNAHHVVAHGLNLAIRSESVDCVLALDVLEHYRDDELGAREIERVLKPGGIAIFMVPAFQILWSPTTDLTHYRRYRSRQLREVVRQSGLTIHKHSYYGFFLFFPQLLVRLLERIVKKKAVVPIYVSREPSPPINKALLFLYRIEMWFMRFLRLPLGGGIVCLAQKKPR